MTRAREQHPCVTTLSGALAAADAIAALGGEVLQVRPLQEIHAGVGVG